MVDPTRLIASARQSLGEILDYWKEPEPIPSDRVVSVRDGETLDLGGPLLRFIATPGHAPHEMAIVEEKSRGLFTGDTVGIYRAAHNILSPASPPPSFDYPSALASLRRLLDTDPSVIMIPHYGYWRNARDLLELNLRVYEGWAGILEKAASDGIGVEKAMRRLLETYPEYRLLMSDPYTAKMFSLDAAGFLGYFEKKMSPPKS